MPTRKKEGISLQTIFCAVALLSKLLWMGWMGVEEGEARFRAILAEFGGSLDTVVGGGKQGDRDERRRRLIGKLCLVYSSSSSSSFSQTASLIL